MYSGFFCAVIIGHTYHIRLLSNLSKYAIQLKYHCGVIVEKRRVHDEILVYHYCLTFLSECICLKP